MIPRRQTSCFTLIELLVVVTLTTVAVGMVTLRLDGLTDAGRLRSTANQIAVVVRLTRADARTSGLPRLIVIGLDQDRIAVRAAQDCDGLWQWGEPVQHGITGGVRIVRVIVSDAGPAKRENTAAARIGPDGRHRPFAVVLFLHGRWAVVLMEPNRVPKYIVLDRAPQADSYETFLLELEGIRESP